MRGIELSEKCFYERFLPTLREKLPEAEAHIAAGLVGGGSECYGFDDEVSHDHDLSDGFYIWLTEDSDIKYGVALSRIYRECVGEPVRKSALPRERGPITVGEFYMRYTGRRGAPSSVTEWLSLPESALFEATNGKVFVDNVGEFSKIRQTVKEGMPEDVRLKKLAARLIEMAQSGQYNYHRCILHGEHGAARLAAAQFAESAVSAVFLLNRRFMPYYKWCFRAMRELSTLGGLSNEIEALLCEQDEKRAGALIESISGQIAHGLSECGLTSSDSDYLEPHAFCVFEAIKDRELRRMHIMEG